MLLCRLLFYFILMNFIYNQGTKSEEMSLNYVSTKKMVDRLISNRTNKQITVIKQN
jgi:hypothetical protein